MLFSDIGWCKRIIQSDVKNSYIQRSNPDPPLIPHFRCRRYRRYHRCRRLIGENAGNVENVKIIPHHHLRVYLTGHSDCKLKIFRYLR